jgi:hypothetical protein
VAHTRAGARNKRSFQHISIHSCCAPVHPLLKSSAATTLSDLAAAFTLHDSASTPMTSRPFCMASTRERYPWPEPMSSTSGCHAHPSVFVHELCCRHVHERCSNMHVQARSCRWLYACTSAWLLHPMYPCIHECGGLKNVCLDKHNFEECGLHTHTHTLAHTRTQR